MSGASWTITLPITRPLSLNDRANRWARARDVKQLRADVRVLARAAKIPALSRISVALHYAPKDRRRRDPLNLVATLKVVEDGLVDAGVVPDDTPDFVVSPMPVIDAPTGERTGRLYVTVREIPADEQGAG